jgi:RNA polymerase sigma-70 factor (ECF subfamily)
MSNQSDQSIFQEIQADKREALNWLFNQYFDSLCHFVNSYLQDAMLSEEVVSDVFFNLWVKRKSLTINGSIKPYLFKAARNQAISYLRRPAFAYEPLASDIRQDRTLEPDALLIHRETRQYWQNLVDRLPTRCKLIFTLHREEDFTYREIADLLDLSEKTVENQMGKALRCLRELSATRNQRSS